MMAFDAAMRSLWLRSRGWWYRHSGGDWSTNRVRDLNPYYDLVSKMWWTDVGGLSVSVLSRLGVLLPLG